jgi:hypothetical protein
MKKLFLITFLFMAMMYISISYASAQCTDTTREYVKFVDQPDAGTAYTNTNWKLGQWWLRA